MILAERERGTTVLFCTHIISDVEALCDCVAVLVGGRRVKEGSVRELVSEQAPVVELTIEGMSVQQVQELGPSLLSAQSLGERVLVRAPDSSAQPLLRLALQAGARVTQMQPIQHSLEDLFLETLKATGRGTVGGEDSMMREFTALALNGFREARRNRVSVIVGLFALGLLVGSTLVTEVTVFTFKRVLVDVGLGTMTLALVMLAIFLSSGLLSREIERRTIFLMMSKPISRGLFLVGRLAGNLLTLGVLLAAMSALFFGELAIYAHAEMYNITVTSPVVLAAGMLMVELTVISCVGFLMSSFASQTVSAIVTVGVFFLGHLTGDLYALAEKSKIPGVPLARQGRLLPPAQPRAAQLSPDGHLRGGHPLARGLEGVRVRLRLRGHPRRPGGLRVQPPRLQMTSQVTALRILSSW